MPHHQGLSIAEELGYFRRMQPATFVPSFVFVIFAVNFACAWFYLNHRRAASAYAATNPNMAQDAAAICARAGVTFQNCFAPLPELGHPGLCLFSAPVTEGSTLSVALDTLSTHAILQRLADWARKNSVETRRQFASEDDLRNEAGPLRNAPAGEQRRRNAAPQSFPLQTDPVE